jgi:hypothetical protein
MMRQRTNKTIGGRSITVLEFNAETVFLLLDWMEKQGGDGISAHSLLKHKDELLSMVKECLVPDDGLPIDFSGLGFTALMALVDGLQEVNQAFLTLLNRMGKVPMDGSSEANPSN